MCVIFFSPSSTENFHFRIFRVVSLFVYKYNILIWCEDRISFVFACFPTNLLQFPLISCPISGFASLLDRLFLLYMKKVYLLFVLTCPYITGLNSWYRLSTSWQTNWLTVTVRADCFIYFAFSLPVIFITFSYSYSAACNTTTSSFSRLLTVILPL